MSNLKIFKADESATIPKYSTQNSACFDLHACITETHPGKYYAPHLFPKDEKSPFLDLYPFKDSSEPQFPDGSIVIHPGQRFLISTGLIFDIPEGHSIRIHPRSGLALKNGITLVNCEGVVDEDYVDVVGVIILNTSQDIFVLKDGDRICQAEIVKDLRCTIEEIFDKPAAKTNRSGGFGSTGL